MTHILLATMAEVDQNNYVTEPVKTGHICKENLALFLNFNLQYLLKYKHYDNEIFLPYSQINKKAKTVLQNLNIMSTDQQKYYF